MKYQGFLQAYGVCLRLYPHKFQQRYAEQMELTAQDMLQDARTGWETTRVISALVGDAGIGLLAEHAKQLGGASMNKHSKLTRASVGRAVLLGVQIVAVPVMIFVIGMSALDFFRNVHGPLSVYQVSDALFWLTPMIMTGLTYLLLGKLELGLWSKIVSSLFTGCIAAFTYYTLVGSIMMQLWEAWPVLQGPYSYLFNWACLAMYFAAFYIICSKVIDRMMVNPPKSSKQSLAK